MAFIAPVMSLVAERVRSVGVVSGASRLCRSSAVFVEPFLRILFFLCVDLVLFWFGIRCRIVLRTRAAGMLDVISLGGVLRYPVRSSGTRCIECQPPSLAGRDDPLIWARKARTRTMRPAPPQESGERGWHHEMRCRAALQSWQFGPTT